MRRHMQVLLVHCLSSRMKLFGDILFLRVGGPKVNGFVLYGPASFKEPFCEISHQLLFTQFPLFCKVPTHYFETELHPCILQTSQLTQRVRMDSEHPSYHSKRRLASNYRTSSASLSSSFQGGRFPFYTFVNTLGRSKTKAVGQPCPSLRTRARWSVLCPRRISSVEPDPAKRLCKEVSP